MFCPKHFTHKCIKLNNEKKRLSFHLNRNKRDDFHQILSLQSYSHPPKTLNLYTYTLQPQKTIKITRKDSYIAVTLEKDSMPRPVYSGEARNYQLKLIDSNCKLSARPEEHMAATSCLIFFGPQTRTPTLVSLHSNNISATTQNGLDTWVTLYLFAAIVGR